jgi:peptide/nickel transport system substrate-binding protein
LDRRVRQALSIAINRQGLTERLMAGTAEPAGQWMPADTFGYNKAIPVPTPDPEAARRLLAEAGFPDGFQLTVHVPSDSYVKGPETIQGVAQMWTRIGVRTTVEAVPWAVFATRAQKAEYLMSALAWGNGTGEASYALINVLGSYDTDSGRGALNWGRYANPAVDRALDDAMMTFDDGARRRILEHSAELVSEDVGVIPLFHYQIIWASRRGLLVKPLTSDRTAAQMVTVR